MDRKIEREIQRVFNCIEYNMVDIVEIKLSQYVNSICNNSNLIRILKCSTDEKWLSSNYCMLDCIQQPIILVSHKNYFELISGVYTYQQLLRTRVINSKLSDSPLLLAAIILEKKPSREFCELLFLNELTRIFLRQYSGVKSADLSELLKIWFGENLFENQQWNELFPDVRNQRDLAEWLSVSTKVLKGISNAG